MNCLRMKGSRKHILGYRGYGIAFAALSAGLYGLCAVLIKMATTQALSVGTMIFARGLCGMLFVFLLCFRRRRLPVVEASLLPKIAVYGILGTAATQILLNLAYFYLPVGTVTTIHFLYPAVVNLLAALLFHRKVSRATIVTLVVITCSMSLFFEGASGVQVQGIVYALLSVVSWVFQLLYMEYAGVLQADKMSLTFYVCAAMTVSGFLYGTVTGTLQMAEILPNIGIIALIALLNNVCATICLQKSVEYIGAGLSAVFGVFEPVGSIVFGAFLLREKLTLRQSIAVTVILVSVTIMIIYNRKKQENQQG